MTDADDTWGTGAGSRTRTAGVDAHFGAQTTWDFYKNTFGRSGTKTVNGVTYTSTASDGVAVAGIGWAAALQIWYKALTTYTTSSTDHAGARTAALNAAAALYGSGSAQYAGVGNAFAGINVGSHITPPSSGVTVTNPGSQSATVGTAVNLQITASSTNSGALTYAETGLPAGLSISSTTGLISGTPTTAGSTGATVTVTGSTGATGTAAFTWTASTGGGTCTSAQLLGNAGFESGSTSWTASSGVITDSSSQAAHGGSCKARLDGYGSPHTDTLTQSVAVPSGCRATLTFWLHVDSTETTTGTAYDKLTVTAGSTTLATYSNLDKATGHTQKTFELSSFAGSTVALKFTGAEDSSLQTGFVVDDTALTTG